VPHPDPIRRRSLAAAAALVSYIEALLRKNEEVNLTSVRDVDEAIMESART